MMQVTAEQTDPCTIVLDISVDEEQVSRTFDSVYREFGRHANVPGFRPGKAPRAVLERYVNTQRIRERALEKLISDSYFKAIEEEDIQPYRSPRIEPTDLEDKKPYNYKAVVPLEPQVTLGEYTGLTIEKPLYALSDKDVDEAIERMRESRARLDRVTDRGVETGDVLIAEVKTVLEGQEASEGPGRRQLVQVGGSPIPGFDDALLGMMPDEERAFEVTYPEDFEEEDRQGKKAAITVHLSSISARRLPELNEEFAKQVAGVETVEELRQRVREREQQQVADYSNQIAEGRLVQQIVEGATVFYPQALVQEEIEDELKQLGAQLRRSGIDYQQYLEQSGQTAEQHQASLSAHAEERVRSILALRQVAQQEGIQVTDADIDAEFDALLGSGQITEEQYDEYKADERRRLQVANALTRQRLHDFLFANNAIVEVEQATPPDPDADEETGAAEAGTTDNEA